MLSLAVLFTAIIISQKVYSTSTQDVDLDTVFEIIRAQQQLQLDRDRADSSSDSGSDSSFESENRHKSLTRNIEQLFEEATESERQKQLREGLANSYKYRYDRDSRSRYNNDLDRNNNQRTVEHVLQLLQKDKKLNLNTKRREVKKQISEPSYVLELNSNSDKSDELEDRMAKYSKVFVVLNPQVVQKSRNQNKLTDLLNKILSLTSNQHRTVSTKNEKGSFTKELRYKGFPERDNINARRYRRNSKELHPRKQRTSRYIAKSRTLKGKSSERYLKNKKKRLF